MTDRAESHSLTSEILAVGEYLKAKKYEFTTVSPASHRYVLDRTRSQGSESTLSESELFREFFGWNRAIPETVLPSELREILGRSTLSREEDGLVKSRIRFSTARGLIFAHSGYPTSDKHSVFFGPDTYRFLNFVSDHVETPRSAVDLGSGSGAGGLVLDQILRERGTPLSKLLMTDITEEALEFTSANAALNGIYVDLAQSDLFTRLSPGFELIISNPPFIIDDEKRVYRDGGGDYGTDLSVKIVRGALDYLGEGGTLLLYTGAPVVAGKDRLRGRLTEMLKRSDYKYSYRELDPDIFGELLASDVYQEVERIAAVGLVLQRTG